MRQRRLTVHNILGIWTFKFMYTYSKDSSVMSTLFPVLTWFLYILLNGMKNGYQNVEMVIINLHGTYREHSWLGGHSLSTQWYLGMVLAWSSKIFFKFVRNDLQYLKTAHASFFRQIPSSSWFSSSYSQISVP